MAARATKSKDLPVGLTKADLEKIFYFMRLNREFDDRVARMYRQGKLPGAAYGSRGQEAVSVGSAYALGPDDVVGPLIRNAGTILVRGVTPKEYLANFLGRASSPTKGRDGNNHLGDLSRGIIAPISMLGSMVPTLAGCAFAFKYRGEKRVALTYIGDGGTSTGEFHEGLNMAAVWSLPFVLIIENNGYAYSTPTDQQSLLKDLVEKARGYGMRGEMVDGNDAVAVYQVVHGAIERARAGEGPTLIEAKTFRMKGHAEHDDASYVPEKLFHEWEAKDPLRRMEAHLIEHGMGDKVAEITQRALADIDAAETAALAEPLPEPDHEIEAVFAAGGTP